MYLGDYVLDATLYFSFTTRRFSTGAPFTLAGTPAISVYKDADDTQTTTGVTLAVDDDGITGWNRVTIDTSDAFYTTGTDFQVVITTGTVDSVSVVGEVVAHFSIENRSSLRPTVAGRTLDVSAGGEAGVDWANVGSPTTAVNLSGTNIDTDQVVASVTGAVGSVTGAVGSVTGNVGGNVAGTVGSVVGAVGSVTGNVGGNVNGSVGSVVGAVGSVTGAVGSVTGSVGSVVGNVGGDVVGNVDGTVAGVTPATAAQVAAVLTTQITEAYRANGAAPTLAQFMSEVLAHLGEASISGTTKTINGLDHTTPVETFTLDDATNPSSITRAT